MGGEPYKSWHQQEMLYKQIIFANYHHRLETLVFMPHMIRLEHPALPPSLSPLQWYLLISAIPLMWVSGTWFSVSPSLPQLLHSCKVKSVSLSVCLTFCLLSANDIYLFSTSATVDIYITQNLSASEILRSQLLLWQ